MRWALLSCDCNPARPSVADSGMTSRYRGYSCEISVNLPTNKLSRTNSGHSTRVQKVGGWHHHPYETLQIPYDGEVTLRVQATNQQGWLSLLSGLSCERTGAMGDNPDRKSGRVPCRKGGVDRLHWNGQTPTPRLPGKWLGERTCWLVFLLNVTKGSPCRNARFGPNSDLGDCWIHGWGNGYAPSGADHS